MAKGLWSGKTKTVGVVVTTILNPFYANVVTGIEEVLSGEDYTILLNSSYEDPNRNSGQVLLEQRVDGIILAPVQCSSQSVEFLKKTRVPFVLVGRNVSNVQSDFVVCDDQLVGRLAAEHLLQQGHERILFINSSENLSAKLRLKGFQEALQERGLDGNGEWVRPISSNHSVQHVLNKALDNEPRPQQFSVFATASPLKSCGSCAGMNCGFLKRWR